MVLPQRSAWTVHLLNDQYRRNQDLKEETDNLNRIIFVIQMTRQFSMDLKYSKAARLWGINFEFQDYSNANIPAFPIFSTQGRGRSGAKLLLESYLKAKWIHKYSILWKTSRKWLKYQSWLTVSFWSETRLHMICKIKCDMQVCMWFARLHFTCKSAPDMQCARLHLICKIA